MQNHMNNLGKLLNLIKYPLFTNKTIDKFKNNTYCFIVCRSLTKLKIKIIFKEIFKINILKINTSILPEKTKKIRNFKGKKPLYKKVYIKLKKGDFIPKIFN